MYRIKFIQVSKCKLYRIKETFESDNNINALTELLSELVQFKLATYCLNHLGDIL